jgi:hypothetical protein
MGELNMDENTNKIVSKETSKTLQNLIGMLEVRDEESLVAMMRIMHTPTSDIASEMSDSYVKALGYDPTIYFDAIFLSDQYDILVDNYVPIKYKMSLKTHKPEILRKVLQTKAGMDDNFMRSVLVGTIQDIIGHFETKGFYVAVDKKKSEEEEDVFIEVDEDEDLDDEEYTDDNSSIYYFDEDDEDDDEDL